MSVRAYKVVKPAELADDSSFNLWHDEEVMDYLNEVSGYVDIWQKIDEGGGYIELFYEQVDKALKQAEKDYKQMAKTKDSKEKMERQKEILETLEGILADFKKGEDYITYECY